MALDKSFFIEQNTSIIKGALEYQKQAYNGKDCGLIHIQNITLPSIKQIGTDLAYEDLGNGRCVCVYNFDLNANDEDYGGMVALIDELTTQEVEKIYRALLYTPLMNSPMVNKKK